MVFSKFTIEHFSASPARTLSAVFSETKNAQLNEVLTEIQEKIILPAHLPENARKLVFNPEKSDFIQRNPVTIELDGLEHTFKTIDRFKDVPNSKKAFAESTKLMNTKEEWENLGTLLAGYRKAGIKLEDWHANVVTRRACFAGQHYAVIECAQQVEKTGFRLDRDSTVITLLSFINGKIISPKGEKNETEQALKWTQMVWDLIQRPDHLIKHAQPRQQPHMNPIVRGLILFSQASAIKEQQAAGASVEALTRELQDNVEFITSAWAKRESDDLNKSPYLNALNVRDPSTAEHHIRRRQHLSPLYYIDAIVQNIKAMELAQEIIGDDAKGLQSIHDVMEQHLKDYLNMKNKTENSIYWIEVYKRVTGRTPDWEEYFLPSEPASE
ncbi:hypothetical protein F53441_630 [Fusarium austroafricanum]|uniref:Uncharacterized protein n=1 Tax=Fusarium austroafricanum TaxID=2364996 RepID=A0A8H4KWV0_9HYPO|nr:hypothetical protein F53441_630 [Fusarium austroafricanum]